MPTPWAIMATRIITSRPYRDYVIDAFNDNRPFDRFTIEQLAGDLLSGSPFVGDDLERQIASGYNRLLQTTHEGGLQPKEYLAIYAADRVRNVSLVWMGATLGCAQCHDHKFDPYTARDFYAMAAFFADVRRGRPFSHGHQRAADETTAGTVGVESSGAGAVGEVAASGRAVARGAGGGDR
jgi:hypothetical protein